jgi:hypothetical protein
MVGFVVDLGYAYYVKRSLQASADAAALAGASGLPDPATAEQRAREYGGNGTGKNKRGTIPAVSTTAKARCISIAPCYPMNAISVTETTKVNTLFLGVLGIDTIDVTARGTACSPCGVKPVDVMLVLDRTLSMCQTSSGASDPSCTDLNNAKEGIRTFIGFMDPNYDKVGLAVLPPARNSSSKCSAPDLDPNNNYDITSAPYLLVPLSSDYKQNGVLNENSQLVSTVNCVRGGGITSYANAIEVAQAELTSSRGRADAINVIVFLSDGAANYGPEYYPSNSPYRRQPCRSGVTSANTAKSRGTIIYSIGYDLNANGGNANRCVLIMNNNTPESPSITAYDAIRAMATDADSFFNQPSAGDLQGIYTKIAASIGGARLIPDDAT